jgi:hypothetical protein
MASGASRTALYSPNCLLDEFSELRIQNFAYKMFAALRKVPIPRLRRLTPTSHGAA